MQRFGIINCGGHALFLQVVAQGIALFAANYILIVDMPVIGRSRGKRDGIAEVSISEKLLIDFCAFLPGPCPGVQVPEFYAENGGLQRIEAAIRANNFGVVFGTATVGTQQTQPLCHFTIARRDHASVSSASQIFRWKETETAEIPDASNFLAAIRGADALRGVLDNGQLVFRGEFHDRTKISSKSEQVHRNNCARFPGDGFCDEIDVDVERVRTYIDKNRSCARTCY